MSPAEQAARLEAERVDTSWKASRPIDARLLDHGDPAAHAELLRYLAALEAENARLRAQARAS